MVNAIFERFVGKNSDTEKQQHFETYFQKVRRHLVELFNGQGDLKAILRGVDYFIEQIRTPDFIDPILELHSSQEDYLGYPQLLYSKYDLEEGEYIFPEAISILELPPATKLNIIVTPDNTRTESLLKDDQHAFAAFVGPTVIKGIPNNGFYVKDNPEIQDKFEDTNPPNQRRGAIAITDKGITLFLTDEPKWKLVQADFPEIKIMVGTSFYYLGSDTGEEEIYETNAYRSKSRLSCYGRVTFTNKPAHEFFLQVDKFVPRKIILQILQEHFSKQAGIDKFYAFEMEYFNSGAWIKDKHSDKQHIVGSPTDLRHDHWLLSLPAQADTV